MRQRCRILIDMKDRSAQTDSIATVAIGPYRNASAVVPRRIVVKLGTNVIMRADGRIALGLLCGLVESVAALRERGLEMLLVSSGAVGLGAERLGLAERPTALAEVQACAAVGQSRLMSVYEDSFARMGCRIAQVLLTEDDFRDPVRHGNLRQTLETLLRMGVIPIVNENDTVSTMELERPAEDSGDGAEDGTGARGERLFGDNDKLSAMLMTHVDADLLVLLSDVDGLFDRSPGEAGARLVTVVEGIDAATLRFARGGNGRGRGGMASKLEAARIATEAGRTAVIANGRTPGVLERVLAGLAEPERFGVGTLFLPRERGAEIAGDR